MEYINRFIYKELREHLSKRYITIITGLRRTGKTTLLKKLMEDFDTGNKIYVDLERFDNRELFSEKNYDNIVRILSARGLDFNQKTLIAIDEVQLLPEIVSVIKYLYDNYKIKFLLTGSTTYYIKNLFTESLAGRKKVFQLSTLNFNEFLQFKGIHKESQPEFQVSFNQSEYERLKFFYEEFIRYGGFPEVVLEEKYADKEDVLNDIINSYLNIDIKNISEIRDQKNLQKLLKMLASRAGTKLNYSKLATYSGISRPSVYNYLELLENTFICTRIPVLSKNPDREIVKAPKIFINDNGLLNQLTDLNTGAQFENAVFNQLKFYGELKYYSLKSGKEIDFILNNKTAIEVKETAMPNHLQQLNNLADNIDINEKILVSRYPSPSLDNFIWGGDIG